jgi:hypothetical protein
VHAVQRCTSRNGATDLLAYRDSKGQAVIQVLQLSGYRMLTKTTMTAKPRKGEVEELPLQVEAAGTRIRGILTSAIPTDPHDPAPVLQVSWGSGRVSVSGTLEKWIGIGDLVDCVEVSK